LTDSLEERVKQVASILVDWNTSPIEEFDHCYALYRISKILKPEFLEAWHQYLALKKMKQKAIEPLLLKTEGG